MLELQLAELEAVAHDPGKEAISNAITALSQFIAVAKAARNLKKAVTVRADNAGTKHRSECICCWCEDVDIATDILFAANDALSAALPSVKEAAK